MRDQQPVDDRARDVLAVGHQHLERGDAPEVERRLTDERMTGMDDDGHPLEIELLEGEPDHLVGVGQAPDHDIELAALQSLQEDAIGAGDQMHGSVAAWAVRARTAWGMSRTATVGRAPILMLLSPCSLPWATLSIACCSATTPVEA